MKDHLAGMVMTMFLYRFVRNAICFYSKDMGALIFILVQFLDNRAVDRAVDKQSK